MATIERYDCERCRDHLEPNDDVVQAIQEVDATTFGEETRQTLPGPTAIFHARHEPREPSWHVVYRGKLSGLRPNAS